MRISICRVTGGPRLPAHRRWTPLGRALEATGDHWTLAIVTALADGRLRLTHLKAALPGVSAGLLDRYVRRMVALKLISRTRIRERPPRVEVELTDTGRELVPIAAELARWGMRRMWSAPQDGEHVDLDALLRLLPALVEGDHPGAHLPPRTHRGQRRGVGGRPRPGGQPQTAAHQRRGRAGEAAARGARCAGLT
jgi:DNA-binding HxlR family transcriptional regulator